jgi:hypothetical protein
MNTSIVTIKKQQQIPTTKQQSYARPALSHKISNTILDMRANVPNFTTLKKLAVDVGAPTASVDFEKLKVLVLDSYLTKIVKVKETQLENEKSPDPLRNRSRILLELFELNHMFFKHVKPVYLELFCEEPKKLEGSTRHPLKA